MAKISKNPQFYSQKWPTKTATKSWRFLLRFWSLLSHFFFFAFFFPIVSLYFLLFHDILEPQTAHQMRLQAHVYRVVNVSEMNAVSFLSRMALRNGTICRALISLSHGHMWWLFNSEIRESLCESGEGVRLPRIRADFRGSPGNFRGSPGNFRGSLGNFRGTPGLLLSSTVRELPGKSPTNFRGSLGNFLPGKSGDFPEARGGLTPSQRLAKFVSKETSKLPVPVLKGKNVARI